MWFKNNGENLLVKSCIRKLENNNTQLQIQADNIINLPLLLISNKAWYVMNNRSASQTVPSIAVKNIETFLLHTQKVFW